LTALVVSLLCFPAGAMNGPSGKITGKVIDAVSGDPLPGATVIIEGTVLGAATGVDGRYVIINVPPGIYSVRASMVGFTRVLISGISVSIDRTTKINFELEEEILQGQEVVIEAKRPLVEVDRTTSVSYIDSDAIANLPVQEVRDILQLQSGVAYDSGGRLHLRGGRAGEVAYLIDGIPVTNQFSGGSKVEIETSWIQELQVISGVFNAEYGQAQSGIINVVTKAGSTSIFSGRAATYLSSYLTSNGDIFMGADRFRADEFNADLTLQGPVKFLREGSFFTNIRYITNDGWLYGERRTRIDDTVPIQAFIQDAQQVSSDLDNLVGIAIPDSLQTGDRSLVPMNDKTRLSINVRASFRPSKQLRVSYALFQNEEDRKTYRDSRRYAPDGQPTTNDRGTNHILSVTHTLSSTTYYQLGLSYQLSRASSFLFEDPLDSRYQGRPYSTNGFVFGGTSSGRSFRRQQTLLAKLDVESQINMSNLVKGGVEFQWHQINSRSLQTISDGPVYLASMQRIPDENTDGNNSYVQRPREIAVYLQDKIELDEMVINVGVRFDNWNPNAVVPLDLEAITERGNGIRLETGFTAAKSSSQLSPRVGLAFPYSERGVLHVSYGHFFQVPRFSFIYSNSEFEVQLGDLETIMGNADLKPERTIAYEVGLQQALTDTWKLEFTVYYKDIKNLLGQEIIATRDKKVYARYVNRDYGNTKGISFALLRQYADLFGVTVDYTFQVSSGNASDPNSVFFNNQTQPPKEPEKQVLPLDWDQRHAINATAILGDPKKWTLSLIGRFSTGQPYTPSNPRSRLSTQLQNGERKPSVLNLDINLAKRFEFHDFKMQFYARIFNVLDRLNAKRIYTSTGNPFQPFRSLGETEVLRQNPNFSVSEIDLRPDFLDAPRKVLIGISVDF